MTQSAGGFAPGQASFESLSDVLQNRPSMNGHTDDVKGAPSEVELACHRTKVSIDSLVLNVLQSVH